MHMIIAAIVYADDAEEALNKAQDVFEQLTRGQDPFDYANTFDLQDEGQPDMAPAMLADSIQGKKLIEDLMFATEEEMGNYLAVLRKKLHEYRDDILIEGKLTDWTDGTSLHYACRHLGEYVGNSIHLYNYEACGIRFRKDLTPALNRYPTTDKEGNISCRLTKSVWVVPADVHY